MIDDRLMHAWLAGRSLARGLPPPVADHGGYRVDTRSAGEDARWIFTHADARITALAHRITTSRMLLKACVDGHALAAILPPGWDVQAPNYFMRSDTAPPDRRLPPDYRVDIAGDRRAATVRIIAADGALAASGHCAETPGGFVYDRIETAADHRRKGLGHAVMAALHALKIDRSAPQLLVATAEGRSLYETLGWDVLSPYATAVRTEAGPD